MKTLIVDYEPRYFHSIEREILLNCPQISINGFATNCEEAVKLIDEVDPTLVFMEVNMPKTNAFDILKNTSCSNFEIIFFAHSSEQAFEAIKYRACGYVLKPLKLEDLLPAIGIAEERIHTKLAGQSQIKEDQTTQGFLFPENIIGIPTMEGFEFLSIQDIIRCEGFQRCTRIITTDRSDIISSYHIGVFKKRLLPYRFYSTHKSHLINLHHIRKYLKEGTIKMADGAFVPVSKRRKCEFIKMLTFSR